jgi:hypothetical protein
MDERPALVARYLLGPESRELGLTAEVCEVIRFCLPQAEKHL